MQLALARIAGGWQIRLYAPGDHRFLDTPHHFVSAIAALDYVQHWQQHGATVRVGSQAVYADLAEEARAGAGLVKVVGE